MASELDLTVTAFFYPKKRAMMTVMVIVDAIVIMIEDLHLFSGEPDGDRRTP